MTRQDGVRPVPLVLATGDFRDGAHPTEGIATFLQQPDGSRVLTLTRFDTDPGPGPAGLPRPGQRLVGQGRRRPRRPQGQQG